MALFNFISRPKPDIEGIRARLMEMLGPQMLTQQQAGPLLPGQERQDITAAQQGTGVFQPKIAELLSGLIASPETRGVGSNLLQGALGQKFGLGEQEKATTFEKNMQALGIDLTTQEGREIAKEIYTKKGGTFFPTGRILSTDEAKAAGLDPAETWWLDPQQGPKKLGSISDTQRAAAGYAVRMDSSSNIINDLEVKGGFDPTATQEHLEKLIPFSLGDNVANFFRTQDGQQYRQAAMNWIRANLRKESGAVISQEEFAEEFRTYFPQPGDEAKVIAQKRKAREDVERNMKEQGGEFYRRTFGDKSGTFPDAPPPERRVPGATYQTPKGPLKWTGTGWVKS